MPSGSTIYDHSLDMPILAMVVLVGVTLVLVSGVLVTRNRSLVGRLKAFFNHDPRDFTSTKWSFHGLDFPNLHQALNT
ncbi:MAG: hypothetical protein K8F91_05910 [Candidatus Obscuribacterales bacterium]|nr:hypothetical protein [Candidatus Obscuribacterales bacterium]